MNSKTDETLVTTIKGGCRGHALKSLIGMGGNVNTRLDNCLLLCVNAIEVNSYSIINSDDLVRVELVLILLNAGICDEYRQAAIECACRALERLSKSTDSVDQRRAILFDTIGSLIKNHPKPKSDDFASQLPKELIASSTKKAWSSLLFSKQYSDVVFVFKNNKGADNNGHANEEILHAHRIVLAASTNYFSRYFDSEWGNSKTFETSNSRLVMEVVLRFMYTGEVPSLDEIHENDFADELLAVSGEYEIEDLRQLAEESIKIQLDINCWKDVLLLSELYNSKGLKVYCFNFVKDHWSQFLFNDCMLELKQEHSELWQQLKQHVQPE